MRVELGLLFKDPEPKTSLCFLKTDMTEKLKKTKQMKPKTKQHQNVKSLSIYMKYAHTHTYTFFTGCSYVWLEVRHLDGSFQPGSCDIS